LRDIGSLLQGLGEAEQLFDKYVLKVFSKIRNVGWDAKPDEPDLNKLLRAVILGKLGDHSDQETINEARKRFENYKTDKKSLPNDVAGVVFRLVVRNGGEKEHDEIIEIFKSATQPEEVIRACRCIGCPNDPKLIKKALEYSLSDNVRSQDYFYPIGACASTPQGREITWNFLKENWDQFVKKGPGLLGRIIVATTETFSSEDKAKEIEEFFKTHQGPSIERSIQQSLESIRSNERFLNRNRDDVTQWLKTHFGSN